MTEQVMIVNKAFKYAGKLLQPGDVFVPAGGTWDAVLTDPDKKYIRLETPQPKPNKKNGKTAHACDYCERVFDTPQGKAAHARFCKEKEK